MHRDRLAREGHRWGSATYCTTGASSVCAVYLEERPVLIIPWRFDYSPGRYRASGPHPKVTLAGLTWRAVRIIFNGHSAQFMGASERTR